MIVGKEASLLLQISKSPSFPKAWCSKKFLIWNRAGHVPGSVCISHIYLGIFRSPWIPRNTTLNFLMGRMLTTWSGCWIYHQRSCVPLCSLCSLQLCLLAGLPGWGNYVKTSCCGIPHGVKMASRAQQQFRKSCRYLVYGSCTKEGFRNSDLGSSVQGSRASGGNAVFPS